MNRAHKLRSIFIFLLLLALFLVPGATYFHMLGDITVYFNYTVPDGQLLYILSKLIGLYAFFLLWVQILYGILHTQLFPTFMLGTTRFHQNMGVVIVMLLALHIVLFVTAVSVRNGYFAYQLLLPNFNGYYFKMVSLGIFGGLMISVAVIIAWFRRKIKKHWRAFHWLVLLAFIMIFFHSYLIGSETRTGLMPYLYGFMLSTMLLASGCLYLRYKPSRDE